MYNKKIKHFLTIFLRNLLNDLHDNKSLQKRASTYLKDIEKDTLFVNMKSYSYSDPKGVYLMAPIIDTNDKIDVNSTIIPTFKTVQNGSLTYLQIIQPNAENKLDNVQVWLAEDFFKKGKDRSGYNNLKDLVIDNIKFRLSYDMVDSNSGIAKYNLVSYSTVKPPNTNISKASKQKVETLFKSLNDNKQLFKMDRFLNTHNSEDKTTNSIYNKVLSKIMMMPSETTNGEIDVTQGYIIAVEFLDHNNKTPIIQPHVGKYVINFDEEYVLILMGNNSGITQVKKILFSPDPITKKQIFGEITYNKNNDLNALFMDAKEKIYQPGYCLNENYGNIYIDDKCFSDSPKYGNYLQNKPTKIKGIQIQDIKHIRPTSFKIFAHFIAIKQMNSFSLGDNSFSLGDNSFPLGDNSFSTRGFLTDYPTTNFHNTIMELSNERSSTSSNWLCGVWYDGYTYVSKIVFSIDSDNNVYVNIDSNYMSKNTLSYYGVGDNNQISTIKNYTCLLNTYKQNFIEGSIQTEKQPIISNEDWSKDGQNILDLKLKYVPVETTKRNLKGLKTRWFWDTIADDFKDVVKDVKHDYNDIKHDIEKTVINPVDKWAKNQDWSKDMEANIASLYKLGKDGPDGVLPTIFAKGLDILGQNLPSPYGPDLEKSSKILGYVLTTMTGIGFVGDIGEVSGASELFGDFTFDIAF